MKVMNKCYINNYYRIEDDTGSFIYKVISIKGKRYKVIWDIKNPVIGFVEENFILDSELIKFGEVFLEVL